MRVSEQLLFSSFINNLHRNLGGLLKLHEQISSGNRINRPSDDPIGHTQVLRIDQALAATEQYLRNIGRADSFLSVNDSTLQAVQDRLIRASELAVRMANDTHSAADRSLAAREVRQIYDQLVSLANTLYEGRYLFAGNQTTTEPFVDQGRTIGTTITLPVTITGGANDTLTLSVDGVSSTVTLTAGGYATGAALAAMVQTVINADATFQTTGRSVTVSYDTDHLVLTSDAVGGTSNADPTAGTSLATLGLSAGTNQPAGTYLGNSGELSILIGNGTSVIINLPGNRLFQGVGVSGGVNLFTALGGLQTALETDNAAGIQTALANLSTVREQASSEQALVGARLNRTETTAAVLQDLQFVSQRFRSERADVDLAGAISELSLRQTTLEATLAVGARMMQSSLLDFIR